MKQKGIKFTTATVSHWLDCGNKAAVLDSNHKVLAHNKKAAETHSSAQLTNCIVHQPVFIAEGVQLSNSIIGPYVSIGKNSKIENSIIQDSIVMTNAEITNSVLTNSVIGNEAKYLHQITEINLGDYSQG